MKRLLIVALMTLFLVGCTNSGEKVPSQMDLDLLNKKLEDAEAEIERLKKELFEGASGSVNDGETIVFFNEIVVKGKILQESFYIENDLKPYIIVYLQGSDYPGPLLVGSEDKDLLDTLEEGKVYDMRIITTFSTRGSRDTMGFNFQLRSLME